MSRTRSPFRRALALFLCAQPVLWMSNVALAQTLEQQAIEQQRRDQPAMDSQRRDQPGSVFSPPAPTGGLATPSQGLLPSESGVARTERLTGTPAVPPAPAIDEPLDPDRYVVGPGDVLELHFWGVENFKLRVTVDLEGRAFVAKVGYLDVRDKTLSAVQRMMRESVARFFPKLGFGVTLVEPRTFLVQVVDDVARPGPYAARALDRVGMLIGRAGGFGPNASQRRVEIRRRDGTTLNADLLLYSLTGDVKHNPYVLDGDVVRVPFESVVATVRGAVNRPGRYELVAGCDLAELLDLAGGLAPSATRGLPIIVTRRGADDRLQQILVDFTPEGRFPALALMREDTVWTPSAAELQQSITVTGALAGASVATASGGMVSSDEASATRRLPFAQGDTVRTLLERAGGPGPLADLRSAYVLRNAQALPVDLYALIVLRDLKADRPVELGDTLVVPFKRQNILVEGAVFKPGPYPYNPTFGVEQYVSLAGGLNRFAQGMNDVYVVTPDGKMNEFKPDLRVQPGSSLVVPERSFSRSEVVGIILSAVGVLLGGIGILITARK